MPARARKAACQPEQPGPAIIVLEQAQPAVEGQACGELPQGIALEVGFPFANLGDLAQLDRLAAAVLGALASAVNDQSRRDGHQGDGEEGQPAHAEQRAMPASQRPSRRPVDSRTPSTGSSASQLSISAASATAEA